MDFTYTAEYSRMGIQTCSQTSTQRNKRSKNSGCFSNQSPICIVQSDLETYTNLKYIHATHTLNYILKPETAGTTPEPAGPAIF